MRVDLDVKLLWLLSTALGCNCVSAPGKPVLINCRSPEKETFTCWWEPGSDGGLPTTHRLFYQREALDGIHECPDYQSAGRNACFFNKTHTKIWVNYNLSVVASNALGSATSDLLDMLDVADIVQPSAPENVTMTVEEERGEIPRLLVKWEPPRGTDPRSGWVTIIYELRVKREDDKEWEEYTSGRQTHFSVYSIHPGDVYMVQVRCKLDHGYWSEWSFTTYTAVPEYTVKERPERILLSIFTFALFAAVCTLVTKRKCVKQCLLPPIPSPKIKGFDAEHLKSGHSEDVLSALIANQIFPPMLACKDQNEEHLIVLDSEGDSICLGSHKNLKIQRSLITPNLYCDTHGHAPTTVQSSVAKAVEKNLAHVPKNNAFHPGKSLSALEQLRLFTPQPSASERYTDTLSNDGSKHSIDCIAENIVGPFTDSGYVDVQTNEESERQEDYSRVSGVNSDNALILQRAPAPLNITCKEKYQHADGFDLMHCSRPHVTVSSKEGLCNGLDNGYVETIPTLPKM